MIILKILTFSYTILSAGRPSRKTSAIRTYHHEEKKNNIYKILQKLPLKPWESLAC